MEEEEPKQKRQLSPEHLEKLKKAREKAFEVRQKNSEIKKFESEQKKEVKLTKKQELQQEKLKKLDETYNAIQELKKQKEEPKKVKPKKEPEPKVESESEEEEEEEEVPIPRKVVKKVQPKIFQKPKPQQPIKRVLTDDELYANASIQMLQKKLQDQTKRRLMSDLFSY